jgi:hypothetical protein
MFRLLVTHENEEQAFALPDGVAKLGSDRENDIVLNINGVSRRHALVRRRAGGIEVADRASKNGLLVEGQRVRRTMLTPGLRVQIGAAWLELEEVSTSEEVLARLAEKPSERSIRLPAVTTTLKSGEGLQGASPEKAALALAFHIAQVGVGVPEERGDLLLRIQSALEARAFATLERIRSGRLRVWECVGAISPAETNLLTSLAGDDRIRVREQVILKRAGHLLLAGRESWFLAAKFQEETLAQEKWRKEFLFFLAAQFFMPVRSLDEVDAAEVSRVYGLVGRNARRTARLLGVSPGTLHKFLRRLGFSKR